MFFDPSVYVPMGTTNNTTIPSCTDKFGNNIGFETLGAFILSSELILNLSCVNYKFYINTLLYKIRTRLNLDV